MEWIGANSHMIAGLIVSHMYLSVVPVVCAIVLSLLIGRFVYYHKRIGSAIISISTIVYTIPSLVMFIALPSIIGTSILNPVNVIIAMSFYTSALLVRSVVDALHSVPTSVLDAADSMGYSPFKKFWAIQLPVSLPVFVAGIRIAAVSTISLVTVASLLGIENLGILFTGGFQTDNIVSIITGLVLIILLAFVFDFLIRGIGWVLTPWLRKSQTHMQTGAQVQSALDDDLAYGSAENLPQGETIGVSSSHGGDN